MKAYGGMKVAVGAGNWLASRSNRFTPLIIATGTHCIDGLVDSTAYLGAIERRNMSCPYRESDLCPELSSP
jgi:hypothetical protein